MADLLVNRIDPTGQHSHTETLVISKTPSGDRGYTLLHLFAFIQSATRLSAKAFRRQRRVFRNIP